MASTIQLKRGSGAPTSGDLAVGELGLDLTNYKIYSSTDGSDIVDMSSVSSTFSTEILANGGIALGDNDKATFGDGDDLQIYHDGSNSFITDSGTGNLILSSNGAGITIKTSTDDTLAEFINDGPANLYYDNSKKLATSSTGVDITGNIEATGSLLRVFETTAFASSDYHIVENGNESVGIMRFAHTGSQPVGLFVTFNNASPDNNNVNQYFINCQDSTTQRFYVFSDGDVVNHDNSYGAISDQSLKQQVTDASSQWSDIKAIQVRNYKYNSDVEQYGDSDDLWRLGVVAQEIETVSPHLVKDMVDDDGTVTKAVKYSVLYMKAVKALQEAMDRIEQLEARVTTLEAN